MPQSHRPTVTLPRLAAAMMAVAGACVGSAGGPEPRHSTPVTTNASTPDTAILWLKEGNARFASGSPENPNLSPERLAEVADNGQHPFAIILTCADSRIPVERVFDRGVGDLFVVRVAGNVSDTDEVGTIEYGVGHLHSPLVVVMGHTGCGAVTAVVSGAEMHGAVAKLVDNIIPAAEWVKKTRPELKGDDLIGAVVEANVWRSIDDLLTASDEARELVRDNKLKVVGAVYDIKSGQVRWLGPHPYQDRLVNTPVKGAQVGADTPEPKQGHAEADAEEKHSGEGEPKN